MELERREDIEPENAEYFRVAAKNSDFDRSAKDIMKKLILPIILFILSGVVWSQCSLAKKEIGSVDFGPPQTIEWNERFPHYMRISKFMPSKWDEYPSLYEECFLHPYGRMNNWTDKETRDHVKRALMLAGIMGEMKEYLAARQFEAIVLMGLSICWVFAIIRKDKKRAEQLRD